MNHLFSSEPSPSRLAALDTLLAAWGGVRVERGSEVSRVVCTRETAAQLVQDTRTLPDPPYLAARMEGGEMWTVYLWLGAVSSGVKLLLTLYGAETVPASQIIAQSGGPWVFGRLLTRALGGRQ